MRIQDQLHSRDALLVENILGSDARRSVPLRFRTQSYELRSQKLQSQLNLYHAILAHINHSR